MYPTKQIAVAQMRIQLETMRSIFVRAIQEAAPEPRPVRLAQALADAAEEARLTESRVRLSSDVKASTEVQADPAVTEAYLGDAVDAAGAADEVGSTEGIARG